MSWFEQQYEGEPCDRWCPLGACESCAFRGGDSSAAQQDSARETGQETSKNGKVGDSKTAPAGNRGLSPTEAAKPHGRTCI